MQSMLTTASRCGVDLDPIAGEVKGKRHCAIWSAIPARRIRISTQDPRVLSISMYRSGSEPAVLADVYGHACHRRAREELFLHLTASLHRLNREIIIMGDFNSPPEEGAVAWITANGYTRCLDEDFSIGSEGTRADHRGRGRHIDFAVGSRSMWSTGRRQTRFLWGDHDAVACDFNWSAQRQVCTMPTRKDIEKREQPIAEADFDDLWKKHENVRKGSDEHWGALSNVAEEMLCKGTGHPRSEGWEPRRPATMHKQSAPDESLRLPRVRRRVRDLDGARLERPRSDALKDALNGDMAMITRNAQEARWTLE